MAVRIESQAEPIPGYRLIERIGGGGFGEVWKAEAPGGLLKAIKFVFGDLETAGDEEGVRAEQELKAMSRVKTVRHPYILSLERYDIIDGQLLIVMELADRNLWDRFRECRSQGLVGIPREELMGYLAETSEALDLMNQEYQLQHLDIKPQNLFLVGNHIKVADFGLVKDLEGMVASVTGGVTPVYAAPETFDGWVSRYCDQYSLAIVYQELLTGQRPFSGTNVRHLILQHIQGIPDLTPLPPGDQQAIARALSKKPEDRHPSCRHLVKALCESPANAGTTVVGQLPVNPGAETPAAPAAASPRTPSPSATPPSGPVTRWIRAHDDSRKTTGEDVDETPSAHSPEIATIAQSARPRIIVPESVGEGVLFPALVIGLGGQGRGVLQRVSALLTERFGATSALPHLRFMYIDTDPEAMRLATSNSEEGCLRRSEVLVTPLHRPSHYLKPRDGRSRVDTWLNPKMLYRIPRQAFSAGMRALGRLALVDNYHTIASRLRDELEECTRPEALAEGVRQTGLAMRRSRPRVYVVTSLAGGTGSGMFLDLAYTVRALLRQLGHAQPDLVGIFLAPLIHHDPPPGPTLGNAYAALTELNHFSTPGTTFSANYDTNDFPVTGAIVDSEPPFSRCILLPAPSGETREGPDMAEALALPSHFLVAELTTVLGRQADERRLSLGNGDGVCNESSAKPVVLPIPPVLSCQTFGLHRLVWPRRALLKEVGRRLCLRLVHRWMNKDSKPVRDQVKEWVQGQWQNHELGPEGLIAGLHRAAEHALGKVPETVFGELIEPLVKLGEDPAASGRIALAVDAIADQLEKRFGKPVAPSVQVRADRSAPSSIVEAALMNAGETLAAEQGYKMAELAVCLIEQPAFRLAGAEEAVRQMTGMIDQALQNHEQLWKELAERALTTSAAIHALVKQIGAAPAGKPGAGRRSGFTSWLSGGGASDPAGTPPQQLVQLLRAYCKSRYQSLVLQQVNTVLVGLRGQLSDQMRDIGFCRNRLVELRRAFDTAASRGPAGSAGRTPNLSELGRCIFPAGCTDLEEAVAHVLAGVTDADFEGLDQRMQAHIRKNFTALVHVCLASMNVLRSLEIALQQEAEAAVAERLAGTSILDMFDTPESGMGPDPAIFEGALATAFEEAAPELAGLVAGPRSGHQAELVILTGPTPLPGAGHAAHLPQVASRALAHCPVVVAETTEGPAINEILIYREKTHVAPADLQLLGPLAREAYRQMNRVEHMTPHTRIDITDWQPAGGEPVAEIQA